MALVLPILTRRPTHPFGNPQLFASQRRSSAWSPRSITITPLVAWYDPSCITTLFTDTAGTVPVTADGDLVACMKDRSGNGNHAIQATSAARPIYRSGGYLDFDGARYLATSGNIQLATLGGYSTAAAVYFNNTTGTQSVIDADNAAGTGRESQLLRLNGGNVETIPFNSGGTPFTDAGPSITATTNLVLTQITSASAGEAFVGGTGNGSTATTGTLQTVATLLSIGAFNTSAGSVIQFFSGRFYGGAHYQGALNANDHAQLVSYFTAKMAAGAITAYTLTADVGTFSYAGQAASLLIGTTLPAVVGTYSYTGQSASFTIGYEFVAAVGTFTYTGQSANLTAAYSFTASVGTFTYTGQAAGLLYGRALTADVGTFSYSGQAANLLLGQSLAADAGIFSYTGQAAGLLIGYEFAASAGIYTYNGQDATLSVAVGYALTAAVGTFTYSGQAASLLLGYALAASAGIYTYAGQTAGLGVTAKLPAAAGIYSYTGYAARALLNLAAFPPSGSGSAGARVSAFFYRP